MHPRKALYCRSMCNRCQEGLLGKKFLLLLSLLLLFIIITIVFIVIAIVIITLIY